MLYSSYGAVLLWTIVAYQLTARSFAQNNGPGYLGCFDDLWFFRSVRGNRKLSSSRSVEWCFNFCLNTKPYKYAGVESATECYCGNNDDYDTRGRAADSECRDTCPGNTNQYCGGNFRIAIYQISQGVCNNAIGPPVHGSHYVTNPTHVSFNLDNSKFFGTRVRFECGTGYVIQGAETIECTQMGNIAEWSNSVPICIAPSLLPTTENQAYTSTTTYDTNVTTSGAPLTEGPVLSHSQASQLKGTIIGITLGVIAFVVVLLMIVISRKRQTRREGNIDGGNGSVKTIRADVTPGSMYEIPRRPGEDNTNPKETDVTTDSTCEMPSPTGVVYANQTESDVTASAMSAYEIPRSLMDKYHQFTPGQSSSGIVHEYAEIKLP